ncbi:MAG: hypothetical protein HKN26_14985 [Acidimicrobiales bacterium]|nr:hypothetical protein [Acidimicrobiales bacterium]
MDEEFGPAALAIVGGDAEGLRAQLAADAELATRRSSVGHPTLLQLVACEAGQLPNPIETARVLIDAGAVLEPPLVAAAGCGSSKVVDVLLDCGADIDFGIDTGIAPECPWTPLDEAIYWCQNDVAARLLARGARVRALSTAAGLGDVFAMDAFFEENMPTADAGPIGSPFSDTVPPELANDRQSILDHAFVMAVNAGQPATAVALLARGAEVNAKPPGYHWRGTALHAACWRGDRDLVRWLLDAGADPTIRDGLADSDALGWARHHGHDHLLDLFSSPG